MDTPEEFIPKVSGCNVGISFFEGELEPVVVLTFRPVEGEDISVALSAEDLEGMLPVVIGACIRTRTVTEMVTIYPEQREEIIQNLMFRWTGTLIMDEPPLEDGNGT